MSIIEIYYEAKCKHCKHLKRDFKTKKDDTRSKVFSSFCGKKNNELISMRDKACNLFEL